MNRSLEKGLAWQIRIFLALSLLLLGTGLLMSASGGETTPIEPWRPLAGASAPTVVLHLGVLALLALPFLRTLWLAWWLRREGDVRSALVSLTVVIVILLAALVGS